MHLAKGETAGHRQRARCGNPNAEVRIGPDEFRPTVNKVLLHGFTLRLTDEGRPEIQTLCALPPQDWGINAEILRKDAEKIDWPDKELLFFLEFGFVDYSGRTPPVCSFSPHQQKAMRSLPGFREETQTEIAQGWIGKATSYPPSVPFQVRPGRPYTEIERALPPRVKRVVARARDVS